MREAARRDGGRNVAVAAEPFQSAEIELGVAAGLGALGVGIDRSLIHDEQVGRKAEHRAVGFEDQVLDAGELGVERREQLAIDLV